MTAYCSVCQKQQNVRVSFNSIETVKFLHCEQCNNFIRSENLLNKKLRELGNIELEEDDKTT